MVQTSQDNLSMILNMFKAWKTHFPLLHKLYAVALVLLTLLSTAENEPTVSSACALNDQSVEGYLQEGDLILGVILQLFMLKDIEWETFTRRPSKDVTCYGPSLRYYRHLLAAVFAIEEINQNPNILPNVTLGFHIYDSCTSERRALATTLSILTGRGKSVPNYKCNQKGTLVAFVGHLLFSISYVMSGLTGIYRFPQISYGAQDSIFNDRVQFPTFYRTVADENTQFEPIIQLLKMFNWSWVGIVALKDGSHQRTSKELRDEIIKSGACVAFVALISEENSTTLAIARETIKQSSANVVIVYSSMTSFLHILFDYQQVTVRKTVWIATPALSIATPYTFSLLIRSFNGSLLLGIHRGEIPGLKDFLYKASPSRFPSDSLTARLWYVIFYCRSVKDTANPFYPVCKANLTLEVFDTSAYDVNIFRLTYTMYTAVYALAHSLHDMYSGKLHSGSILETSRPSITFTPWQLNQYMKKVNFKTTSGDKIFFDEHGATPGRFDILNWNVFPNGTVTNRQVGTFNSSAPPGKQLVINKEAILWGPQFNGQMFGTIHPQIPRSTCSNSCPPGYRKALQDGMHVCCYSCVRCTEGEISTIADMENCMRCPEDQWSNPKRDRCIMRAIDFLSYENPLGFALASIAAVMSVFTVTVLCIFMKHQNSPIVKANNRGLSYSLLLSLTLCFLCSLLFIGRPAKVTCLIRQAAFGIIFAICISCVLGKTITVVIAFNATKPGSKLRIWVGTRIPKYLVLLCSLGEVLICTFWLIKSPPFPDYDSHSQTAKIIFQCNEGSVLAFYLVVGYIALLASVSFFVAYLARKLPDTFNEAQYITFSMLVFCSVWVSFIPAYLSTKGKYMVAVEIFAMLSSSAGLLGFIFIPKCYVILLQPELNTRSHIIILKSK